MRIFPLGESALTIEFGRVISPELNERAIFLARRLTASPFAGMIEAVPAYASVSVYFDLVEVRRARPQFATAFEAVRAEVTAAIETSGTGPKFEQRELLTIPFVVNEEASPDLRRIAVNAGLSSEAVLELFLARTYKVYMLGFLPGFAYMGEVDERLAMPRLSTPRTKVAQGSIGIAGRQTGIYPLASPGGWNIIGRTQLRMFDAERERPSLLAPGDEVRFELIDQP